MVGILKMTEIQFYLTSPREWKIVDLDDKLQTNQFDLYALNFLKSALSNPDL